jgi:PAS domain S-box-containing protein
MVVNAQRKHKDLPGGADPAVWSSLDPAQRQAIWDKADAELAKRGIVGMIVYPVTLALLFALTSYPQRFPLLTALFMVVVLALVVVRTVLELRVAKMRDNAARWRLLQGASAVGIASMWGVASALAIMVDGLAPVACLVLLCISGISGGAVSTLAGARTTSWLFTLATVTPAGVAAIAHGTSEAYALAVAIVLFIGTNLVTASRVARERWSVFTTAALIEQREREFRDLIERNPLGMVILREGKVVYANPVWATILGYDDPRTLSGATVDQLIDGKASGARRDELPEGETRLTKRDGSTVVVELSRARAIRYEEAPALLVTGADVTEKQQILRQLRQADRLASVGTLAAGIGHEINNPLNWMTGNIHFAREELQTRQERQPDYDEIDQALAEADEGAQRVSAIVKDLRTFARKEDSDMLVIEPLYVQDVIASALSITGAELRRHATVKESYQPGLRTEASESHLVQVLVNLLLNAAQAHARGQSSADHSIEVRNFRHRDQAVIEVHDTGRGIPPDVLPHIFDPFFTTKPAGEGTGLGLSISHKIIRDLGGTLELKSELGKGTTATIRLNATRATTSAEVPISADNKVDKARILVIDDEELVGRAIARGLREHAVTIEQQPEAALTMLASKPDAYDLVLCDLMMPSMSGMDLYQQLQARQPSVAEKIVFITGDTFAEQSEQFLANVPNAALTKPFDFEQLRALVAEQSQR